jgi:hypothetical protein
MSHQDRGLSREGTTFGEQLRKAVHWLVSPEVFADIEFREDCTWTPWLLVAAAMVWVWSGEPTLTERFDTARSLAQEAFGVQCQLAGSYQAWMKMLVRWTSPLRSVLLGTLRGRMRKRFARHQIAGRNVFGVDGSRFELPRTASNQTEYCPQSCTGKRRRRRHKSSRRGRAGRARQKKAENPQMWITTMWHATLGLPWDWRTGPSDSSERSHLLEMIRSLPATSLVAADAGFVGYEYWKALLDAGHDFVIRVGANVKLLKHLGYARERNGLVYLWPDAAAAKGRLPLVLRLVVVHNGKHPVYLATNLLDAKELSDDDVAEIYRHRWGIEVYYRGFKQTFQRRKLRSYKAEHAQVELDWSMVGLWAVCLYAQHCGRMPPRRLSVAGVLRAFRRAIHHYAIFPQAGLSLATRLAQAIIDDYPRTNKASRNYPRKKQEKPAGSPEIIPATQEQMRRAREVKQKQRELGLTA